MTAGQDKVAGHYLGEYRHLPARLCSPSANCTQSRSCGLPVRGARRRSTEAEEPRPASPRVGARPKPPLVRALGPHLRKPGGFLSLYTGKPPKLRACARHLRTFGGMPTLEARKPPKVRASGSYVRKTGGFLPLHVGKPPKLRALCPHVRKTGGFAPRDADKPPKPRASDGHARKRGGFVVGPPACGRTLPLQREAPSNGRGYVLQWGAYPHRHLRYLPDCESARR